VIAVTPKDMANIKFQTSISKPMGLFDFLINKRTETKQTLKENADVSQPKPDDKMNTAPDNLNSRSSSNGQGQSPDVPEKVFVEYERPKSKDHEAIEEEVDIWNLRSLYDHLSRNLEKNGYEDALTNPDTSYMNEHVEYLKNDINLLISRIKNYYSGYLGQIEFHIESRKRNGMVETVEELVNHKKTIEREVSAVISIEEDTKMNTGLSQNLILSYKKGFKNGFAAITYNTILNRKE
jgi:hypothetical protein